MNNWNNEKSWTDKNISRDRNSFPFNKQELDVLNGGRVVGSERWHEVSDTGNFLYVENGIIPTAWPAGLVTPIVPFINFNNLSTPNVNLLPFSVFPVEFEKYIVRHRPVVALATYAFDYASPIIIYTSDILNRDIQNYRAGDKWLIGKNTVQVLANPSTSTFSVYVPFGAERVNISTSLGAIGAGDSVTIQVWLDNTIVATTVYAGPLGVTLDNQWIDVRASKIIRVDLIVAGGGAGVTLSFFEYMFA